MSKSFCLGSFTVLALITTLVFAPDARAEDDKDGARFRGAIALSGGGLFVSGFSAGLGGVDGRLGVQVNNLFGLYAQPHFTFGAGKVAGQTGFTGTAGGSLLADFTLADSFFFAAGGGGTVVGSVAGGMIHGRLGGYPLMSKGENGVRRKGLMLGSDVRVDLVGGYTVLQVTGSIGYEAF